MTPIERMSGVGGASAIGDLYTTYSIKGARSIFLGRASCRFINKFKLWVVFLFKMNNNTNR